MKRLKRLLPVLLALCAALVAFGWDYDLKIVRYTVDSPKITQPVRVLCLSDLHSCSYGEGQWELLDAVNDAAPDVVVLTGDIYDDVLPPGNTDTVLADLGRRYPCFYVTGNHDVFCGDAVAAHGITPLNGDALPLVINGQDLLLCGLSDPRESAAFAENLTALNGQAQAAEAFTVLLSHRPARIGQYLPGGWDLIFSGHAHGGQCRIPGLLNGLLAPDEGLFPRYAGGRYDLEGTTFVVSRGLAKESTRVPRLYNPPELVLVEIQ
ncbi:MAG: metallophosphoesterase [Clostridia bacterium]|nr:metallophosphoesterase [Clostridia bacterium]